MASSSAKQDEHWGVSQRTLCKNKNASPQHVTGGYLERAYPEGEADQTSLGGCRRHLKFDKIDRAAEFCIGSAAGVLNAK